MNIALKAFYNLLKMLQRVLPLNYMRIFLVIIAAFLLASCEDGECISGIGNFGHYSETVRGDGYYGSQAKSTIVSATDINNNFGQWYNTGIPLVPGQLVSFTTVGSVTLGTNSSTINFDPKSTAAQGPDTIYKQNSPVLITFVTGSNLRWWGNSNSQPSCGVGAYTNGGCWGGAHGIGANVALPSYSGSTVNAYGNAVTSNNATSFLNDLNYQFNSTSAGQNLQAKNPSIVGNYLPGDGIYFYAPIDTKIKLYAFDTDLSGMGDNMGSAQFSIRSPGTIVDNAAGQYPTSGALIAAIGNSTPDNTSIIKPMNGLLDSYNVTNAGTLWLKVYDTDIASDYKNNFGQYYVNVTTTEPPPANTIVSSLATGVINPVKKQVSIAAQHIYHNIAGDSSFHRIAMVSINLYIILYAVFFMFGLVQISQQDLLVRLIKIGVILNLVNSNYSWQFFNQYLFSLFMQQDTSCTNCPLTALDYLINVVSNGKSATDSTGTNSLFNFIDQTLGLLFSKTVWQRIGSLIFVPSGFIYTCMLLYIMFKYIFIVIEVVLAYIFALVTIALLIAVAPLFIMCVLFERTKEMFDNWIKALLNITLQPVILFACVLFVNQLINIFFYQLMSVQYCYDILFSIDFSLPFVDLPPIHIYDVKGFVPQGTASGGLASKILSVGNPMVGLFILMMMFVMLIKLLEKITTFASTLAGRLVESYVNAISLSGERSQAKAMADSAKDLVKKPFGQDSASTQRREGQQGGQNADKGGKGGDKAQGASKAGSGIPKGK